MYTDGFTQLQHQMMSDKVVCCLLIYLMSTLIIYHLLTQVDQNELLSTNVLINYVMYAHYICLFVLSATELQKILDVYSKAVYVVLTPKRCKLFCPLVYLH